MPAGEVEKRRNATRLRRRSGACLETQTASATGLPSRVDLFNGPTKRVGVELERLLRSLALALAPEPDTHPCGFRGSRTRRSQSGCRPGGASLGRRRARGSHPGHQRGGCLRASTCRCMNQTRLRTVEENDPRAEESDPPSSPGRSPLMPHQRNVRVFEHTTLATRLLTAEMCTHKKIDEKGKKNRFFFRNHRR